MKEYHNELTFRAMGNSKAPLRIIPVEPLIALCFVKHCAVNNMYFLAILYSESLSGPYFLVSFPLSVISYDSQQIELQALNI